jgi:drug/metabolite transporter (DMT)-like permease
MDPFFYGAGLVIVGAVVWVVCAIYAYRGAPARRRNPVTWAILGVIFGPFALFALYLLPKGKHAGGSGDGNKDPRADLYEVPKKKG